MEPNMSRFSSLFAPIRRGLLERAKNSALIDPFQPLGNPGQPASPLSLAASVGPSARNRPDDVKKLAAALRSAGLPKRKRPARSADAFNSRMENAVRGFQRRHNLVVDGLLMPKDPTSQALNSSLALTRSMRTPTPPLKGLSGEAFSANARLVRAMMKSTENGIVPN